MELEFEITRIEYKDDQRDGQWTEVFVVGSDEIERRIIIYGPYKYGDDLIEAVQNAAPKELSHFIKKMQTNKVLGTKIRIEVPETY